MWYSFSVWNCLNSSSQGPNSCRLLQRSCCWVPALKSLVIPCIPVDCLRRSFKRATAINSVLHHRKMELESNVRHTMQRQMQLVQLCDEECEASVARTNALISQAILQLQTKGTELVAATRSCYSQAKEFHSHLHTRTSAVLAKLQSQPAQSRSAPDDIADAGAQLLKIMDDARASPLCVGCGGCGVSVDLSSVAQAIAELQVAYARQLPLVPAAHLTRRWISARRVTQCP